MKRFITFIENHIEGKKVLMLFILANVVYAFMLLVTIPNTMRFSQGMKLLDMMPMGYDFDYVNTLFASLGIQGRNTYLTNQIPVDMVYPFLFGLAYCLIMGYFLKQLNSLKIPFALLCVLPVIAATADYLENFGIITLLNTYPDITQIEVKLTMVASLVKSISTSFYFMALIILLLVLGIKRVFLKHKN